MEHDLYFTLVTPSNWKIVSESGKFRPKDIEEETGIRCYSSEFIEEAANALYSNEDELLLIVIDPLRIQSPIRKNRIGDINILELTDAFSIDAVIDRITIKKSEKGRFDIKIKHFD